MRGKGATPAASIQLHMVIQFPITGSCPYWALADPSAVAGSLLVAAIILTTKAGPPRLIMALAITVAITSRRRRWVPTASG